METRTVEFHVRRQEELLRRARQIVADYLGAGVENTAFVVNTTTAMNWVAHSLRLGPEDEVLLNDHEYGAVFRCWDWLARERGFRVTRATIPLGGDVLKCLQGAASARTRVVVLSHITSATAQRFPVAEVGAWARSRGILSVVDGAHAPGHIDLDLENLGVDFYMGNMHKWLWAPKGSALLWISPACQSLLRPLVVSWGVDPIHPIAEPEWVAWVQLQATRDPSAFLAAPAGVEYQVRYHKPLLESHCYQRIEWLSERLEALGAVSLPWSRPLKMRAFHWPFDNEPGELHRLLFERYRVEVPVYRWNDQLLVRVSLQHYVCDSELDRLVEGLSESRVAAGAL